MLSWNGAARWSCEVEPTTSSVSAGGAAVALASLEPGTPSVRVTVQGLSQESGRALAGAARLWLTIEARDGDGEEDDGR